MKGKSFLLIGAACALALASCAGIATAVKTIRPKKAAEPQTGVINFNGNETKINGASVTGDDSLGNEWTITTVGTTSYTSNSAYYQVGSSSKPATSITFTMSLDDTYSITSFSAKFGGFSGTAGNVSLKVDSTEVGSGSLNATNDVIISNSSSENGSDLSVSVTSISKGVKVYYVSYTYQEIQQPGTYYTVTFESNGGTAVPSQTVSNSGTATATEPSAPTRNGYDFAGWFLDEGLTSDYDFGTAVTADLTLYAKWTKVALTNTYSASTLTNGNGYRIRGEVTAKTDSNRFFIQDGDNSMQIYDATVTSAVTAGNTVDLFGTYSGSYMNITNVLYHEIISDDTTNSQTPLTSLNDATAANVCKYFEIPKIQLNSGFSANKASIKNSSVVVYYRSSSYVNGGSFSPSQFATNDYVSVKGGISKYNDAIQLEITSIQKLSQFIVTFNANALSGVHNLPSPQSVLEGDMALAPASNPTRDSDEDNNYTFGGWYINEECTGDAYDFNTPVISALTLYAKWNATPLTAKQAIENISSLASLAYSDYVKNENYVTDTLNRDFTGIADGSGYNAWSNKTGTSGAIYAGQSAGGNNAIQLRSNNSNSGIVVTAKAGYAKTVTVAWNENTSSGRKLDIYGKNTAYDAATDLYNNSKQGTKLGTIVYGTSTSLTINTPYAYIGVRSNDGALYLDSLSIEWDKSTYDYENLGIRFGASISETLWNRLDTESDIQGYGVLLSTPEFLTGDDLKDKYDLADDINVKKFTNADTDHPENGGVKDIPTLKDGNYVWNLYKRISFANAAKNYVAVAFIQLAGDEVVFLNQVTANMKDLAQDLIDNNPNYDAQSFGGSLSHLANA